jgi:hypothetical protein
MKMALITNRAINSCSRSQLILGENVSGGLTFSDWRIGDARDE